MRGEKNARRRMPGGRIVRQLTCAAVALLLVVGAGCGGFGPKPDLPPVLPSDLVVGSSGEGGGALTLLHDFTAQVVLTRSATLGPLVLYTSIEPAFDGLAEDDPDVPIYVLAAEIPLTVELTAIDEGATVRFDTTVLSSPGDVAEFVMAPGGPFHPGWRVGPPEGSVPEPHRVSFRIGDASGRYGSSATYTLDLVVDVP